MIFLETGTSFVYDKETGQFKYFRKFESGESAGPAQGVTLEPVELHRVHNGEIAFFRNGQWEYEPDPDWVDPNEIEEEIADDQ